MSILAADRLTVRFGGLTAVNGLSFSVRKGDIFAIIGPNGAGKTTVFNAITGLLAEPEGEITIDGKIAAKPIRKETITGFCGIALLTGIFSLILFNATYLWEQTITARYTYRQPFSWSGAVGAFFEALGALELRHTLLVFAIGAAVGFLSAWSVWRRFRRTPDVVCGAGVCRTFQNIRLFRQMSALDNILVAMEPRLRSGFWQAIFSSKAYRKEEAQAREEARRLLDFVGLAAHEDSSASSLPYGLQRRLEIARALASKPLVVLLDEPAAGMNPSEAHALQELITKIRETGVTVLLIEHHMNVVMSISDRIVVLDFGNKIAEGSPAEVCANPRVIEAYLGCE